MIVNLVQVKTENLDKQVKLLKLEIKPDHKDSDFSKLLSRLLEAANLTLNTCIPLESRCRSLTRLSLAEYSLYSGFVVLTRVAGVDCGDGYWAFVPNSPLQ